MAPKAIEHVKEYKVPYLASLLVPIVPLALAIVQQTYYIDNALQTHQLTEIHPQARTALAGLEKQVDLLLELQLAKEIHAIMLKRCKEHDTSYDQQLVRLQKAYKELTGANYPRVSCENTQ